MLSKEERKQRNTDFWDQFKKRMNKHRSVSGRSGHWLKYPTEVRDVYLRLIADKTTAICFDIQPKDDGIRSILWEQMTELKRVMENEVGEASYWNEMNHFTGNQTVSRICWENKDLSFYRDEDWPGIFDFLEDKLLSFDRFYQEFKDILITLAE